jgi:hypothetical protein
MHMRATTTPGATATTGAMVAIGGSRNGDWLRLIAQTTSISHAHFLRVELLRSLEWGLVDKRRVLLLGRMAITQQHQIRRWVDPPMTVP